MERALAEARSEEMKAVAEALKALADYIKAGFAELAARIENLEKRASDLERRVSNVEDRLCALAEAALSRYVWEDLRAEVEAGGRDIPLLAFRWRGITSSNNV
ncbi:hypothetical protein TUZN_2237 [Thermoproteus uzoniensis 768-20]|uniref:Uncharacterized protein n=1 Tax=Thermoproteus uzoniensis (strain 768-20) TaxID=999630 RepID=F2L675_THEU7|nr:hypothetical protein TUZN_2237 [Thermoproteus uzoniensis 768-20]